MFVRSRNLSGWFWGDLWNLEHNFHRVVGVRGLDVADGAGIGGYGLFYLACRAYVLRGSINLAGERRLHEILAVIALTHFVDVVQDDVAFGLALGEHDDGDTLAIGPRALISDEDFLCVGEREAVDRVRFVDDNGDFVSRRGDSHYRSRAANNEESTCRQIPTRLSRHRNPPPETGMVPAGFTHCSESKSDLRVQAISGQLTALEKVVVLELKGGVLLEIDPDSDRWTVIFALQEIHGIVHGVAHVLITKVGLVDAELSRELHVGHRASKRFRRADERVGQDNGFVEKLPLGCDVDDVKAFDVLRDHRNACGIEVVVIPGAAD